MTNIDPRLSSLLNTPPVNICRTENITGTIFSFPIGLFDNVKNCVITPIVFAEINKFREYTIRAVQQGTKYKLVRKVRRSRTS